MFYLARWIFTGVLILALGAGVAAYGAWDAPQEDVTLEELDTVIAGLEESVERARRNQSAHPDFLADLESYLTDLVQWREAFDDVSHEDSWGDYHGRDDEEIQPGLVFWADFHERDYDSRFGVVSDRTGDYEVILADGVEVHERGRSGGAFHSSSYELDASRLDLDPSGWREMTIEMWVYLESWGPHGSGYSRLLVDDADDRLQVFVVDSFHRYNSNSLVVQVDGYRACTEENSLQLRQWHHIAVVYDGDAIEVYVDGRSQDLRRYRGQNEELTLDDITAPLWIGNRRSGGRGFQGMIDDIKIYDRTVSSAEVRRMVR